MAKRPFLAYPDKRLRAVCDPIEQVTEDTRKIWQQMLDAMYAMPGIGLAANQIGILQRLAVVDCSGTQKQAVRMANPELLHVSGKLQTQEEGSPNLPGVYANIDRPRGITVAYLDETGTRVEKDFVGLWATSVQHQIDHLNGKMFFDHLSAVKRKMLLAKAAKLKKRG